MTLSNTGVRTSPPVPRSTCLSPAPWVDTWGFSEIPKFHQPAAATINSPRGQRLSRTQVCVRQTWHLIFPVLTWRGLGPASEGNCQRRKVKTLFTQLISGRRPFSLYRPCTCLILKFSKLVPPPAFTDGETEAQILGYHLRLPLCVLLYTPSGCQTDHLSSHAQVTEIDSF